MTRVQTQQALRQLPVKWALALLAIIVLYAFAQPALNSRLGWNLPSLARLMGEPEPKQPQAKNSEAKNSETKSSSAKESGKQTKQKSTSTSSKDSVEQTKSDLSSDAVTDADESNNSDSATLTASREPASRTEAKSSSAGTSDANDANNVAHDATGASAKEAPSETKAKPGSADAKLLFGILREIGRDRYVSIEGLQYNPGSEEGHRLKHLERHLKDMPDRPGKHGVFDGQMKDALKYIDDAYARGKRGAKGVRKTQEENRTIYEVPFTQPIGYIGGRDGNRNGKPPAKRLRLVVEGSKFITAFPF